MDSTASFFLTHDFFGVSDDNFNRPDPFMSGLEREWLKFVLKKIIVTLLYTE